jgi:hypothetical protein
MYCSRVKSIKSVGMMNTYDLNTPIFHNFFLDNGVLSHNSGKSYTVLKCLEHIEERRGTTVPISNICGSIKEFSKAVHHKEDNEVFVLDEGKELESANWQNKGVKAFKKWITKNRMKSHIYFICFPNPLSMMPYIRNDKLSAVLLMKKPGVCYIYHKYLFDKIIDKLKEKRIQDILDKKPTFISQVPKYEGHLLKEYTEKKRGWLLESDDEFIEDLGISKEDSIKSLLDDGIERVNTKEAAKMLKVTRMSITNWVKKGWLKPNYTYPDGKMLFLKQDINEIHQKNMHLQD